MQDKKKNSGYNCSEPSPAKGRMGVEPRAQRVGGRGVGAGGEGEEIPPCWFVVFVSARVRNHILCLNRSSFVVEVEKSIFPGCIQGGT